MSKQSSSFGQIHRSYTSLSFCISMAFPAWSYGCAVEGQHVFHSLCRSWSSSSPTTVLWSGCVLTGTTISQSWAGVWGRSTTQPHPPNPFFLLRPPASNSTWALAIWTTLGGGAADSIESPSKITAPLNHCSSPTHIYFTTCLETDYFFSWAREID